RTLLAGVGIAHRGQAGEEAGEVPEEIELGTHPPEVAAGHGRARVRPGGRADDHVGERGGVDVLFGEAVEEAAVPGEIPFAAADEDEGAINAFGERRKRRRIGKRYGETVRRKETRIELSGDLRERQRDGASECRRGA